MLALHLHGTRKGENSLLSSVISLYTSNDGSNSLWDVWRYFSAKRKWGIISHVTHFLEVIKGYIFCSSGLYFALLVVFFWWCIYFFMGVYLCWRGGQYSRQSQWGQRSPRLNEVKINVANSYTNTGRDLLVALWFKMAAQSQAPAPWLLDGLRMLGTDINAQTELTLEAAESYKVRIDLFV